MSAARPLALALLLAAAPSPAKGADFDKLKQQGRLRVVVWKQNLAELFDPTGAGSGFEKELLDGFAGLERIKLEIVAVDGIDDRIPALLKDKADLVAGGVVATEARRKLIDFTAEVFPVRHVALSRTPHPPVADLEALRLLRVCTVKGSSWADEVAQAGVPAQSVESGFTSSDTMLEGLKAGKCQAAVMTTVWAVVAQRHDPSLQLGVQMGDPQSLGFGVRHDQPKLRAALDAYLANVRRTPTWSRLVVKYFGPAGLEILRRSRS